MKAWGNGFQHFSFVSGVTFYETQTTRLSTTLQLFFVFSLANVLENALKKIGTSTIKIELIKNKITQPCKSTILQ